MSLYKKLSYKLYYLFADLTLKTKLVKIPSSLESKKNIFIYFDYEREYCGRNVFLSDSDIITILELLSKYGFQTTWFVVGKIFEKYPDSVKRIMSYKHEIGSHTYEHISPYNMSKKKLELDFALFSKVASKFTAIRGFHPPKGQWNIKSLKYLSTHGFLYELAGENKKNKGIPVSIIFSRKDAIIRLKTLGDDWPFFSKELTEEQVFSYLKKYINNMNIGEISGIGFHPWILFSNKSIFGGFKKFLRYIHNNRDFEIKSISEYLNILKGNIS